jgi:beta-galactosidase
MVSVRLAWIVALVCVAGGFAHGADADVTSTSRPAASTQPAAAADAVLPAGMSLDWDKAPVVALNDKRSQMSLNGIWRFIPATQGSDAPADVGWGFVKVPGSWQNSGRLSDFVASGVGPQWEAYDGTRVARAWFERQVMIPADWQGRVISLRFDRVCTDARAYVNVIPCGTIAWPWGSVDITSAVKPGEQATIRVLVAAIADAQKVATFWQSALSDTVSYSAAGLKTRGLTGSVFLESRATEGRVSDVFVRTSTRKKQVALHVELAGVQRGGSIEFTADMLNEAGKVEKSFSTDAAVEAKPTQSLTLSWPWADPRLWDVGQPNLYTLRLTAKGAGVDDQYNQKFGFREFWAEGRKLYLNGTEIHLRQTCFIYGPRGQVGDNFVEMGSPTIDARGDAEDSGRSLDDADRQGYLVAQYILDCSRYMMDSRRRFTWEQNQSRAMERADVWMRHYRNHPSVVMWIAGMNFFNNAVDADPRHVGRRGWDLGDERWKRLVAAGQQMFDGLKQLDPTRLYYSHAGAYSGDVYTMNCYLDLLPLQEREEWLSAWAQTGQMPISMVEFGTPMDCTYRRGHEGFTSNITSEPLLTEYAAIYFGADAYAAEEPKYRQFLHDLFRGGMLYGSSENRLDEYADNHKIQQLFRTNTWRSWRTAGLPGGLRTWSWMQDALKEVNGPTLAWIAGPPDAYTAKDHNFSSGQTVQKQIVLINDTRGPQDFTAAWTATVGGKEVGRGESRGSLAVSEIRFLPIQFGAPAEEPAGAKVDGQITLTAAIGQARHQDVLTFRVFGEERRPAAYDIAVVDPDGLTTRMLKTLGYTPQEWKGEAVPLLVIGRNALKQDPTLGAKLEPYVQAGGRALICAQDPAWMTQALGWRVCPNVSRRVFPVGSSSPLSGLDADDLRDWTGSSTLIEPYPRYEGDYLRGNEREQPYAGWHWGNRGAVSSAAIEKPHRSGWRPLLECEFDLAYTPLMELDFGQGRVIVCTLDLEDHVSLDPAARRMAAQIMQYASHAPLSPRSVNVEYIGGPDGAAWLDRLGVSYQRSTMLDPDASVLLIGPDAALESAKLTAYIEKDGKAFFLPRQQADGPLGTTLKPATAQFAGSLSAPPWTESRGLSASDLRWRSYLNAPPWVLSAGAEIGADGLLGRKTLGQGVAIFCQVDPDGFHADDQTYFRYTRWRATRAIAQLLANLGAQFVVDRRIFHPLDTWEINLDGDWQMQVTGAHPAATSEAAAAPDPGVSAAARKLLAADSPAAQGWKPVTLPQMLPFFQDHDGEAVFRKEIDIPMNEAGKDLILSLGVLHDFDTTCFNGVEVGALSTANGSQAERNYVVPAALVKAGRNVIVVRLYNRFGPGGFAGKPGFPIGLDGNRSGRQSTGPRVGLEMSLKPRPQDVQFLSCYHPDYRTDFHMGDNPYRYYRW